MPSYQSLQHLGILCHPLKYQLNYLRATYSSFIRSPSNTSVQGYFMAVSEHVAVVYALTTEGVKAQEIEAPVSLRGELCW